MSKLLVCLNVLWEGPLKIAASSSKCCGSLETLLKPSKAWQDDSLSLLETLASLTKLTPYLRSSVDYINWSLTFNFLSFDNKILPSTTLLQLA